MRIFGITGWKNNGKTTLVVKLVEHLTQQGYRVSTVKHAHHEFDIDHPGRDSFQHREAGASEVLVASSNRWALMHELQGEREISLTEILDKLSPVDLVIVEGFKNESHPKLQVYRSNTIEDLMVDKVPNIVAIATDQTLTHALPVFDINQIETIAEFIIEYCELKNKF